MSVWEQLAEVHEGDREDGMLYVRYAGWRDETRKLQGKGTHRFRRPDGGEIVADVLNDQKIQIHARSGTRVRIRAANNPTRHMVHHLPSGTWVDLLTYDGPASDLEREPYAVDVARDYIRPAIERFMARTHASGKWGDRTGTTLNLQVGANNDDGWEQESTGNMDNAALVRHQSSTATSGRRYGFHRFTGVSVPVGATVNSATLSLTAFSNDDMNGTWYCEDADSATAWDGVSTGFVTSLVRTTASVSWIADSLGTIYVSRDVTGPVAEVVARAGWSSGSAITLLCVPNSDALKAFDSEAYNSFPATAAKLDIDYTAGGGGGRNKRHSRPCSRPSAFGASKKPTEY